MDYFNTKNGVLHCEEVSLADIAAEHGTPCFVYSRATLERHFRVFDEALAGLPHLICYAVKANSNLAVLNILAEQGSGFDIVSGGELQRVLAAGGDPGKIMFSGVGKTAAEMVQALEAGIRCFNVESEPELERLAQVAAELGVSAPVSLRVNPDVDPKTHPYISTGLKENKFGLPVEDALALYRRAATMSSINLVGIDCHIGSQLLDLAPIVDAAQRVLEIYDQLVAEGIHLHHIDIGGGLGVPYQDENPPSPADYVAAIRPLFSGREVEIILEPGRAIAGNAGVLLTQVEFLKPTADKNFAIVDAAMTELLRPTLYNAWQDIVPVTPRTEDSTQRWDIVGPVCETGDWLGKDRQLALQPGDVLAIRTVGAYGFVMASNYNSRPRPPEIMVDGQQVQVVRQRETAESLFALESTLAAGSN